MVVTRRLVTGSRIGSGAGSQDRPALSVDHVSEIIREEVIGVVWKQFPGMFWSIKTVVVEYFDECYAAITEMVVAVAIATVTTTRGRSWLSFPVLGFITGTYSDEQRAAVICDQGDVLYLLHSAG